MKSPKTGKRHPLLLYRHMLNRIWPAMLLLGLLLLFLWGWTEFRGLTWIESGRETWLLALALMVLIFSLLIYIARWRAFVQAHKDHLRLVTPFIQVRISYRRIRSIHPASIQELFPPNEARGNQNSVLDRFYGSTAVVVELDNYPISLSVLRMFLTRFMFSPKSKGFVFLVPDWMRFSTELDSMQGNWLQTIKRKPVPARHY